MLSSRRKGNSAQERQTIAQITLDSIEFKAIILLSLSMANRSTDQSSFPLLSVSPEVRNLIYSFALTSSLLRTRSTNAEKRWTRLGLVADRPKKRVAPSINLLLANHQIHYEASHVLYNHGRFVIPAFVFNTLTATLIKPLGVTTLSQPVKTFAELATKPHHRQLCQIRNIDIEISWFRSVRGPRPQRSFTGRLDSICRGLDVFAQLKTVTLTWQSYSANPGRLKETDFFRSLGKQRTMDLLQSFRKFQDEHPDIVVVVDPPTRWMVIGRNAQVQARVMGLEEFVERFEMSFLDRGTVFG